jgi:probable F420-dependent oxidoreductase
MRFTFVEAMCDPSQYIPMAKEAEKAGFYAQAIPDSIAYPEVSDSKYPYTPDGNRQFLEGKAYIDPFTLISMLGAVTERLRFNTFVVKLAIRHPVLVAKQVSSLSYMTGERFGFGVGLSPWPEDFRLCGVPWEKRGARMDEMITIIRGLLTGDYFGFDGEHFKIERIKMCPVPKKPVPILIGGHSEAALRRAARIGDGWMHAGGDPMQLDKLIVRLNELRREYGRDKEPFEVHAISFEAYSLDGVKRLEEIGVTDTIVGVRNAYEVDRTPLSDKLAAIRRFGDEIISKV